MIVIKGVPASSGVAIGKAAILQDEEIVVNRIELPRELLRVEVKRFKSSWKATLHDLDVAEARVLKLLGKEHAKLIEAHRLILSDTLITRDVPKRIVSEGVNAEFALSETLDTISRQFERMEDPFFRERRHDLFDVGRRLLSHLLKQTKRGLSEIKSECVLIAHNLLPSDTLGLHGTRIMGFATDLGGRTSHTSILAQSLGIPAAVGLSDASRRIKNGDLVILDGEEGLLIVNPGPETVAKYQRIQERSREEDRALDTLRGLPTVTLDGKVFRLEANLDSPEELKAIVALEADGIGLFRTEYLFLNHKEPPGEAEQTKAYARVIRDMDSKPVVIRTADLGGDRLAFMGSEAAKGEPNPFMGLRGIRLFLRHTELFKTQLRAILRAGAKTRVLLLLPMVSSIGEVQGAKRILNQVLSELEAEGVPIPKKIELGLMVEIPSAAIALDTFLPFIDFVSVGTNDLIQYTLAVDRINEHVAHLYEPFHPAVLRLIDLVVKTAHGKGKWVGVCGEMASDSRAVPLLVGLGVDSLSVSPRVYLRIKQAVRRLRYSALASIVTKALAMPDADGVRRLLAQEGF